MARQIDWSGEPPADAAAFSAALGDAMDHVDDVIADGPFSADWDSLADHVEAPEWFRDAKLGIYCTWGPYSVPAFINAWYPKHMHEPDHELGDPRYDQEFHEYHLETYGSPEEAPYHDFAADFTAEHFDPEAWADLFEEVGCRFAGPIAEHHDGWSNWDSAINPWNAGDRGPERDILGELESAIRDRGMRFITTFHHTRTRDHYEAARDHYPSVVDGYPEEVMYGAIDDTLYEQLWLAKLAEVIDRYEPDLLWHDSTLPRMPEEYRKRYLAYYFNRAAQRDQEVVVTAKSQELPTTVAIEDFEMGRPAEQLDRAWLTDTPIMTTGWAYNEPMGLKDPATVVHELIDIVSKNGCLQLNFGPRADGTIPEGQKMVLRSLGEWMETHGVAIYETRPWGTFGEGPTRLEEGGHFLEDVTYTAEDVRYTRSKDRRTLYAIVLGWPVRDSLTLECVDASGADGQVNLIGGPSDLEYSAEPDGLQIEIPHLSWSDRPSDLAIAFELTGFGDVSRLYSESSGE